MKGVPMATGGGKESSVRIKPEPMSPSKLSSAGVLAKFSGVGIKKEVGRLASFGPPRDLSLSKSNHLTGIPKLNANMLNKRVVIPNLKPGRRKGQAPVASADSTSFTENKPQVEKSRRPFPNRSKYIQEAGVFSAGLAPGKPREYNRGTDNHTPQLQKPKLNLNRTINKKKEDGKLKDILKDDFVDDPSIIPDLSDCPKSLPLLLNAKPHSFRNLDDTFESLQLKTEKFENVKCEDLDGRTPDFSKFFSEPGGSRLIVMDFPDEVPAAVDKKSAKESKHDQSSKIDPNAKSPTTHRLANLGEGHWGTLRILANGAAYILVGKERIPVMMTRHCPRQTVMSVALDAANSRGELCNLGQVSATLKCFSDLSPVSIVKHE